MARMHRTLKAETARPPEPTMERQQKRFDEFRRIYNEERPHEALGQKRPATIYRPHGSRILPRFRRSSTPAIWRPGRSETTG